MPSASSSPPVSVAERMEKPDRTQFARDNAGWLVPAFGAVLLAGILLGNAFAMLAGVGGLGWVAWAVWLAR